jgi:sugar phosphate isomerase/epimerase
MNQISRRDFVRGSIGLAAGMSLLPTISQAAVDNPQSPWQIGCYTRPWDQYEYTVALDAIAEAGYRYVGLMTAKGGNGLVISVATTVKQAEQVGAEVRKRKLEVPSVYGGDIPVGESLQAGIDGLKKLIDNCAACGAKNLMMGGVGDEKLYEPYFAAIRACCDYAAEKKIGISMKPHGGLNATGPQCRKSIELVGHKNFRLWYDPGNIFYYSDAKLNPVDDAATVDGLVIGMSVKDFRLPKEVMLTPGTGMVDFPAVMARLIKGGFNKGPLIVECLTRGTLPEMAAEAKKARVFLEGLVAKLPQKGNGV